MLAGTASPTQQLVEWLLPVACASTLKLELKGSTERCIAGGRQYSRRQTILQTRQLIGGLNVMANHT